MDIPEIDTILFLRPTESATVFLQQFGRGLRLHKGKDHLTVLDFVGHSRAEFSYKDRFEAPHRPTLAQHQGRDRGRLHQCPLRLQDRPGGKGQRGDPCQHRRLSAQSQPKPSHQGDSRLPPSLPRIVLAQGLLGLQPHSFPQDLWRPDVGRDVPKAGVRSEVSVHAEQIKFAVNKKWLATDSFSYFTQLLQFVASGFRCDTRTFSEQQRRSAVMLYYDLYDKAGHYASIEEMFRDLASDPLFVQELHEVVDYLRDRCSAPEKADNSVYQAWNPLRLHGVYSKAQIQAALGLSTIERKSPSREGVERLKDIKLEAMYVDIIKKREEGSMTAYRDYAQNREFFHWETQNRVREGSRGRGLSQWRKQHASLRASASGTSRLRLPYGFHLSRPGYDEEHRGLQANADRMAPEHPPCRKPLTLLQVNTKRLDNSDHSRKALKTPPSMIHILEGEQLTNLKSHFLRNNSVFLLATRQPCNSSRRGPWRWP